MDQSLLNELNKGEKLVEMTEFTLHDKTVFKVIIYTCKKINVFNKRKIETFEFPFYFENKTLAEEFLKYWDDIWLTNTTYWDNKDKHCFAIYISDKENYILVDQYKKSKHSEWDISDKCQLTYNGIWGGMVCKSDAGRYHTFDNKCFYYTKIFDLEDIGRETNKTYVFKMIKED